MNVTSEILDMFIKIPYHTQEFPGWWNRLSPQSTTLVRIFFSNRYNIGAIHMDSKKSINLFEMKKIDSLIIYSTFYYQLVNNKSSLRL